MHHIAATIGCTVRELKTRISWGEYADWMAYFDWLNPPAQSKRNLLNSPDQLLAAVKKL